MTVLRDDPESYRTEKVLLLLDADRGFNRGVLKGIARYAAVNGPWTFYRKAPSYVQNHQELGLEECKALKPDGIICSLSDTEHLCELNVPMVAYDPVNYSGSIPCIQSDHRQVGRLAARHLFDRGHRDFAFFGYKDLNWSDARGEAFSEILHEEGRKVNTYPHSVNARSWSEEEGSVSEWLKSLPKPVGLFCVNDDRAFPILELCRELGFSVPEDISVIGADNDEMICSLENPPLTSVELGADKAGYEASQLLHDLMKGRVKPEGQRCVAPATGVKVRQSTDVLMVHHPEVRKALSFIREHLNEGLQVKDVIDATSMSHRYLNELFKQELGSPVGKYLNRERIMYISRLLSDTDMRIQEIALAVGYEDDRHFARYFKRFKGLTPKAYRRQMSAP